MSPDKLAYMANQIGRFFDPRMRRGLLDHLDQVTLDPLVAQAVQRLKDRLPA